MFQSFRLYLFCGGGIDVFCSTTKYSPHDLFTFTESIDKQQPLLNLLQ